jgi:hypothetical protein
VLEDGEALGLIGPKPPGQGRGRHPRAPRA